MTTENVKTDSRWSQSTGEIILWLAIVCFLATAIAFSWNPTPFAQGLAAIFIASAFAHACVLYSLRSALVLFFI
jgi:putative membrane protein